MQYAATASLLVLAVATASAFAQDSKRSNAAGEFQVVTVASVTQAGADLKPGTILFNDGRPDQKSDQGAFIAFEEWARDQAQRETAPRPLSGFARAPPTGSRTAFVAR